MLQKPLPWQLQEELLWQRKLQVQKDWWQHLFPLCCEPETAVPSSQEASILFFVVWQPVQTNCTALDNERGDITNLFAHPNVDVIEQN